MKICYIGHSYYPGNVPFYVHTQLLAQLGCEVHAIARRRADEPVNEAVENVQVHRILDDTVQILKPLAMRRYLKSIHAVLSQIDDVDIVHVTNNVGASLLPLLYREESSRWILEIRSPPLHKKWRTMVSNLRVRMESRAFDAILVHARAVGEDIFGTWRHDLIELPIGADFEHFKPYRNHELRRSLGLPDDALVLVYSGSMSSLRQLSRLIHGFQLALSRIPSLYLLMVGAGNDKENLQHLAQALGIAQHVLFVGYVTYADMPAYLQCADIGIGYVPITPWYDKAPVLKTIESLATGLPTIATKTLGNQEYIIQGKNGLLSDDTPLALAESIISICTRAEVRESSKLVARNSVEKFDFRRIVRETLYPTYCELRQQKENNE